MKDFPDPVQVTFADGTGSVKRYADFPSRYVTPRTVDIWLPPGYAEAGTDDFPVLYMHDGQNLFDPGTAYLGVDWGIDETLTRLIEAGAVPPTLVVGIWNTPQRRQEYMPQKPLTSPEGQAIQAQFESDWVGDPQADGYLGFLAEEVKPFVDATYRTLPDRDHTAVMGSSMGGLISLYALVEYPDVFGKAGCVSTHWPVGGELMIDWLAAALPKPGQHKLYFDFGTATLDEGYEPFQLRMDALLEAAGYRQGEDCLTQKFPGAEHSERAWRARVEIPLRFLLG